ncbi:MAG TPA: hypothetical protein VM888_07820 [Chitinophagaceae bacterium]|nr:hypothetical protein [Chitinophagaceae bacterium]
MDRIEKLKEFLATAPNDAFIMHALALEYVKKGEDDTAQELFVTLLKHHVNYVGSYYHLGKLLERKQNVDEALKVYEKGMQIAKEIGDNHAFSELKGAHEDLIY